MHHGETLEGSFSATYVENYLSCVENLPNDVQRMISRIRELNIHYLEHIKEVHRQAELWESATEENNGDQKKQFFKNMQNALIAAQELGDEKVQLLVEIQDKIGNRLVLLEQDSKNLNFRPKTDRKTQLTAGNDQSTSSPTTTEKSDKKSHILHHKTSRREQSKNIGKSGRSTPKDKPESEKRTDESDSTTDLDEPMYCICQKKSAGKMIKCDNDLCYIEWFHFSCLKLTTKPKGKWYCPKCQGETPTVMKPRAQFFKEMEMYNKEKEQANLDK